MTELKPCPFCGGEAKLVRTWHLHHIICRSCGANIGGIKRHPNDFRTRDEVIAAWNRRSIDRGALLDLADELEEPLKLEDGFDTVEELRRGIEEYERAVAERIRKAVGA